MRALVTGATGKVGHSVARALLERGDEVQGARAQPGARRRACCLRASRRSGAT